MEKQNREPIAIVGMACRFPGKSNSLSEYWDFLMSGKDGVTEIPEDRWDAEAYYHPDYTVKGKINVKWGGFLDNIDKFDAQFFSIPPLEALRLDPQQRMLLETSYQALEDGGFDIDELYGKDVGVFVGISAHDYGDIGMTPTEHANIDGNTIRGGAISIASNRISYVFNFRGPSYSVDTACSSSLIAAHNACSSIWNGEASMALVGGVNSLIKPEVTMSFSTGGFLSPTGRCKTFDKSADGYIRSEGVGVVVLKPLSKAIEDGDKIYTTIISSAINHDGLTDGISMPSQDAQIQSFKDALKKTDLKPSSIQYVEAHGTGTAAGDPIEATSLGMVYGEGRTADNKLYLGSAKSNIGHTEPASGTAGLIKLAMSMYKGRIPGNVHFKEWNPKVPYKKYNLAVVDKPMDWPAKKNEDWYAGINSFGFGGANAHLLLKDYKDNRKKAEVKREKDQPELFTLSARSQNALKEYAQDFIDYINNNKDASLYDICYTANVRTSKHHHRLSVVAHSKDELAEHLKAYLDGETRPGMNQSRTTFQKDDNTKVAFVCSGQGPQWWGMARELLEKDPIFKETVERADKEIRKYGDWSLIEEMTKDENSTRISETNIAQPALFAVQVGLAHMWKAMGVEPDGVVGHSIGEVASAYLSGMLTFEEACKVIFYRSAVQQKASGKGKMLAVGLPENKAKNLILGNEDKVSVATINGPNLVTLSGDEEVLKKVAEDLDKKDIFHRFLVVEVPFHSPYMEPLKDDLMKELKDIQLNDTKIDLYSTVIGRKAEDLKYNNEYWYKNVRDSVRFTDAVSAMIADGYNVFVELSPHPILARYMNELLEIAKEKGQVVHSIRRKEEDRMNMLGSLGALFTAGYPVDFRNIYSEGTFLEVPKYPFQRESFWIEAPETHRLRIGRKTHPFIKKRTSSARSANDHVWDIVLDKRLMPWIDDHRVQGPIVFPGAGSTELTFGCAMDAFGDNLCFLEDINFKKAIFLPDDGEPPEIQLNVSTDDGSFYIYSRKSENDEWTRHVTGKIKHHQEHFEHRDVSLDEVKSRVDERVNPQPLYDELYSCGLHLGPSFRGITDLFRKDTENGHGEAYGRIVVPENIRPGIDQFNIHPAILDAAFQCLFGAEKLKEGQRMGVMVPVHIDRVKFHKQPTTELYSYGRVLSRDSMFVLGEIWIFDAEGNLCIEIQGFKCRYIEGTRGEDKSNIDKTTYKWEWKLNENPRRRLVRKPKDYIPSPVSIKSHADKVIKDIQERPEREVYDNEFEPLLNQLTAHYIEQAYQKLGFKFEIGREFTTDQFLEEYKVIKLHHKLLGRCMEILGESGLLKNIGDRKWKVIAQPKDLDLDKMHEDYMREYGDFKHELIMLGRCAPFLAEIFEGTADAVQLLFPEEEWNAIIEFYQESYSFKKYNDLVRGTLTELLKDLPKDQTLRVLEVGAGTGGMTSAVLPVLPAERTEYVFTDLSYMFMVKAQERFSVDYPFLEFKTMDISKPIEEQGIDPHSFDIVVASDVLHATQSIKDNLENVKKILAPNGVLIMLEVTQCPWWTDLVFGLTEGWWMFEDYDLRPNHPTMTREKWMKVFDELGYHNVLPMTEAVRTDVSAQTVFMARNTDFAVEDKPLSLPEKYDSKGNWLIYRDNKGIADKLAETLKGLGQQCIMLDHGKEFKAGDGQFTIDAVEQDHIHKVFDLIKSDNKPLYGIINCWNMDHPPVEEMNNENLEYSYAIGCTSVLNMIRELFAEDDPNEKLHFWVVTNGAQNAGEYDSIQLSQSSIWGLSRSLMHEYQQMGTTVIDLSKNIDEEDLKSLTEEICLEAQAEEVAIRGKIRYLHKFSRVTEDDEQRLAMKKVNTLEYPFHLVTKEYGMLDNLMLQETNRKPVGKGEVEIQPVAIGLNFKDVMIAMGLLHEDAPKGGYTGKNFGMECAGRISAVGEGVTDFKVGDEVMAVSSDSFSSLVVTKAEFVSKKPSQLSFEEAATIPFAYITAYYSLNYLGRMRKGDKVLIHSASGGVGVAAIRLAQQVGAEVFATVGSSEKRDFLRRLGVKHIMDSRSLKFADEIMELTDGKGVDIVLNSLSGSAIYKSLSVLGRYGRFIEIGKTDIYDNNQLNLRPFGNNLSYFAVDIDKLLTEKPGLCGELIKEYIALFRNNGEHIPAHPYHTFPISRIVDAFNFMAHAKHIGKVIVKNDYSNVRVAPSNDISTMIKDDASYLITGGWSGLGLSIAEWFVEKGAKNLILMSRSGAKNDDAKEAWDRMRKAGANVMEAKCDVGNYDQVKNIIDEANRNMPPIKGIIHSAMVLDDAIIPDMTHDRFMKAIRPKSMGGWNLHRLTERNNLDFFVSFSSVSGQYGTPAQCNYAAGNLFLDMMALHRQAQGDTGSTISWGVISEVGFVARNESVSNILESQGWRAFTPEQACDYLGSVILRDPGHRAGMDVEWPAIAKYYPRDHESHRFGHLLKESEDQKQGGGVSLKDTILETPAEKREETLQHQVAERIARILGTSANKLDMEEPISNMGLDSLMANQLRNWIHLKLDVDFSMMKIMRGPSVIELTKQLLDEMLANVSDTPAGEGDGDQELLEPSTELDKWVVVRKPNPNAKYRLFCFPYMGGGATAFNQWPDYIPEDVEVCAIQYPGREERMDERPFDNVEELVKMMAEVLQPMFDKPFSFYGHSIGAGISFKLAHYLETNYNTSPDRLFVGGWIAPHLRSPFEIIENMKEDEIMSEKGKPQIYMHLRNLEISEDVLNNEKLMDEMMPSIRADILLGKRYKYTENKPLSCPIVAFAGDNDTVFTVEQVKAWEEHTNNKFDFNVINGGHLFIRDNKEIVPKQISNYLKKAK